VEGLAIHNTSVCLRRRDRQQVFDQQVEEDQVQKAGRGRQWPLMHPALDDFSDALQPERVGEGIQRLSKHLLRIASGERGCRQVSFAVEEAITALNRLQQLLYHVTC
jgi:hypothetical protein